MEGREKEKEGKRRKRAHASGLLLKQACAAPAWSEGGSSPATKPGGSLGGQRLQLSESCVSDAVVRSANSFRSSSFGSIAVSSLPCNPRTR
jgi:hypothetical protein